MEQNEHKFGPFSTQKAIQNRLLILEDHQRELGAFWRIFNGLNSENFQKKSSRSSKSACQRQYKLAEVQTHCKVPSRLYRLCSFAA